MFDFVQYLPIIKLMMVVINSFQIPCLCWELEREASSILLLPLTCEATNTPGKERKTFFTPLYFLYFLYYCTCTNLWGHQHPWEGRKTWTVFLRPRTFCNLLLLVSKENVISFFTTVLYPLKFLKRPKLLNVELKCTLKCTTFGEWNTSFESYPKCERSPKSGLSIE